MDSQDKSDGCERLATTPPAQQPLRGAPPDPTVYAATRRALVALRDGRGAEALAIVNLLAHESRGCARSHAIRGHVLRRLGRDEDSRAALEYAVSAEPSLQSAWRDLAELALKRGDVDAAQRASRQAVKLRIEDPYARYLLGRSLLLIGRRRAATRLFSAAFSAAPTLLGGAIAAVDRALGAGDVEGAVTLAAALRAAVPDSVAVGRALARSIERASADDEAVIRMRGNIAEHPDASAHDHLLLAVANRRVGRIADARAAADVGRSKHSNDWALQLTSLVLPSSAVYPDDATRAEFVADWDRRLDELVDETEGAKLSNEDRRRALAAPTNFYLVYSGADITHRQRRYADLIAEIGRPLLEPASLRARPAALRMHRRVGFVSACMRYHAVTRFFGELIGALPRPRYESIVFAVDGPFDEKSRTIAAHVDRWVADSSDTVAWAEMIAEANCDVLVYLDPMAHPRVQALASVRLAPKQVLMWHTHTTGFATFDLALLPEMTCTVAEADRWSEPLHPLPGLGAYFDPQDVLAPWPIHRPPSDRMVHLVCAQFGAKVLPVHDLMFLAILDAIPDAELTFLTQLPQSEADVLSARLLAGCSDLSIDAYERIHVLPAVDHAAYARVLSDADILLDTISYSGSTTSLEAFALGIPVVTLPGNTMRSRMTAAMLDVMEMPELVVSDKASYVARVVELAHDQAARAALNVEIRSRSQVLFRSREVKEAFVTVLDELLEV